MLSRVTTALVSVSVATLIGCSTAATDEYEATARVTYTWQVQYSPNLGGDRPPRIEKFASTSLINRNGVQPDEAVTGPDDRGLWWPALPPRPRVDELEARRRSSSEEMSQPELIKSEEFSLTYDDAGFPRTLPTNYQVYRQAVRAQADDRPLELTLSTDEHFILKAEPK
jgi:hypothetical protein